jgi:hypothetical protein
MASSGQASSRCAVKSPQASVYPPANNTYSLIAQLFSELPWVETALPSRKKMSKLFYDPDTCIKTMSLLGPESWPFLSEQPWPGIQ